MSLRALPANLLWMLACFPGWLRFQAALRFPRYFQTRRLARLLRINRGTAWGRRHGFAAVKNLADWRRQPVTTWGDYQEDLSATAAGARGRLTAARVLLLEPTSGSGAATKFVPYTAPLQAEFRAAIDPWVFSVFLERPRLLLRRHYWSLSPGTPCPAPEGFAVPAGFASDAGYLGWLQQRLARVLFSVPESIHLVRDQSAWEFLTLLFLVRRPDVGLISVWHPSFLTQLLETLSREGSRLAATVATGTLPADLILPDGLRDALIARLLPDPRRAAALEEMLSRGESGLTDLWPGMQVISCWDSGRAAAEADRLRRLFPGVLIQGKGLLATEGVVSIPWNGRRVAAVTSHVLEFEDRDGTILPLWELVPGSTYGVLLTTGGGLYRYRLGDLVRCVGFRHRTPLLEFLAREGAGCDLVGEKLTQETAEAALRQLEGEFPASFAMLAPEQDGRGYILFIEDPAHRSPGELSAAVEAILGKSYHYLHARRLRQLRPVRVVSVTGGADLYRREMVRRGMKLGDVKPVALHPGDFWAGVFLVRTFRPEN